jgi:hypothetical protein
MNKIAFQRYFLNFTFLGADVTHPGPGIRDRPSIASLVSSFDSTFSRYAAFTRVQPPRVEVIEDLEEMFIVRPGTLSDVELIIHLYRLHFAISST